MQDIEPYYHWRDYYVSEEDERSPFFEREYSEFEFSNTIYNFFIHPQWDEFGSATLYLKVLFADYENGLVIIELLGEWNDAVGNDIMFLKRDVADEFIAAGIHKFVLIGENVLNFHASDNCYYEEWLEDIGEQQGWIALVNFRDHVLREMRQAGIGQFVQFGDLLNEMNWRTFKPFQMDYAMEQAMQKMLR